MLWRITKTSLTTKEKKCKSFYLDCTILARTLILIILSNNESLINNYVFKDFVVTYALSELD